MKDKDMKLSFDDIEKIIKAKITNDELLPINELNDLAEKSHDLNFMQVNALYAVLLEDHSSSKILPPTVEQVKTAIWKMVVADKLQIGHTINLVQIGQELVTRNIYTSNQVKEGINLLITLGWIEEDGDKAILTAKGYQNL